MHKSTHSESFMYKSRKHNKDGFGSWILKIDHEE